MSYMDDLLAEAKQIYAYRKLGDNYRAPETLPKIQSDQVMAVFEVLVQEIEKLKAELNSLKGG